MLSSSQPLRLGVGIQHNVQSDRLSTFVVQERSPLTPMISTALSQLAIQLSWLATRDAKRGLLLARS